MTSKQRAYLKSIAMTTEPILQIGKSSLTPEFTQSAKEALEARELIKISVLQNCMDDPKEIARVLAERTGSQVVQEAQGRTLSGSVAAEQTVQFAFLYFQVQVAHHIREFLFIPEPYVPGFQDSLWLLIIRSLC